MSTGDMIGLVLVGSVFYVGGAALFGIYAEDHSRHPAAIAFFWPIVVACLVPRAIWHAVVFGLKGRD